MKQNRVIIPIQNELPDDRPLFNMRFEPEPERCQSGICTNEQDVKGDTYCSRCRTEEDEYLNEINETN